MNFIISHLLSLLLLLVTTSAAAALDPAVLRDLASDDSDKKIAAIGELLASGDKQAEAVLRAMNDNALFVANDRLFYRVDGKALDAATGAAFPDAPDYADSVVVNNRVRGTLQNALAAFQLFNPLLQFIQFVFHNAPPQKFPTVFPKSGPADRPG